MLDNRSKDVLKFLVNECKEGSYKIIEIDEIIKSMPNKYLMDLDLVSQIIKHLENRDYISVKYADNEQFCLCPLPFGRQFIENESIHAKNKKDLKKIGNKIYFFSLLCALLGSFLGTLLFDLIFKN